jgi:hypothetical protein
MAAIHQQIAAAETRLARLERFADRRERFLDAIDWRQMTGHDAVMAEIADDDLAEELGSAHGEVEHLHRMEILGYSSRYDQTPFDPDMPGCMGRPLAH